MSRRIVEVSLLVLLAVMLGVLWLRTQTPPKALDTAPAPRAGSRPESPAPGEGKDPGALPSEWFWLQRAYPHADIKQESMALALAQAAAKEAEAPALRSTWTYAGPGNIGSRVTDLAVHPSDPDCVYAAMASGGVFRSVDGGASWTPLFDEQAVLPVGAIALDPADPQTLYVGTGEANAGSYSFFGMGVYKSTDAGESWTPLGLEKTCYIGRIVVDPSDGERVFVAGSGRLFGTNPERGVYRSTDGGANWELVHSLTDSTACIDLALDPGNPDVIYAAMWERVRTLTYRRSGGESSGIWRSTDGGDTWQELTSGLPAGPDVGRIGLGVSPAQPGLIYAIYADATGFFDGIYKSEDGGATWTRTHDNGLSNIYASYGWWFGNIRVDPVNPQRVFALGLYFYRSETGGESWTLTGANMHVDHHALAFAPSQSDRVYDGNDGGLYRSDDGGVSWTKLYDQPTSQFYAVEIDHQDPARLYGGTQDNGTLRSTSGGTEDWERIYGGDGFYCNVDYTDSDVIYASYQYGSLHKSEDGGASWIQALEGIPTWERRNWATPVIMDPVDHETLYYATCRLYRTTDGAALWNPISEDLTGGDQGGNYGTISTLAVAPSDTQVLYVGTDDGRIWVTPDRGGAWQMISAGLPDRWVTRLAVDPTDAAVVYAAYSGFLWDSPAPHIFRSADSGASWEDISADLPDAPVNALAVDPDAPSRLYAGTDVGVYGATVPGGSWQLLAAGLPRSPVMDLKIHAPTRKLVAGTHGRSMWTLDLGVVTAAPAPPVAFALSNHPNPFNPTTTLRFRLPASGRVRLAVYDAGGRRLAVLLDEPREAGDHAVTWRAVDAAGRDLPAGAYFARLSAGGQTASRKLILIR